MSFREPKFDPHICFSPKKSQTSGKINTELEITETHNEEIREFTKKHQELKTNSSCDNNKVKEINEIVLLRNCSEESQKDYVPNSDFDESKKNLSKKEAPMRKI